MTVPRSSKQSSVGVCRLCGLTRPLRCSHLLPAALYRLVREPSARNPNPIVISEKRRLQTSHQYRTRLLCELCERRFDRGGESWVLARCYRGKNKFRLRDALARMPPIHKKDGTSLIAGNAVPEIVVPKLLYFAVSVFWRAAAHTWEGPTGEAHIELGKYQEGFRQFLLGKADFPEQAVMHVSVSTAKDPLSIVGGPQSGIEPGRYHVHHLFIPGVSFRLFVGKLVPAVMRRACILRSPENLIYFSDRWDEMTVRELVRTVGPML